MKKKDTKKKTKRFRCNTQQAEEKVMGLNEEFFDHVNHETTNNIMATPYKGPTERATEGEVNVKDLSS